MIKEFTYRFAGARLGSHAAERQRRQVGWRPADLLGHGPGHLSRARRGWPPRSASMPSKIRFINKWNGSTFGAARLAAERFYPLIAHLAKVTGRPVKVMLPKDQELAQLADQAGDHHEIQGGR